MSFNIPTPTVSLLTPNQTSVAEFEKKLEKLWDGYKPSAINFVTVKKGDGTVKFTQEEYEKMSDHGKEAYAALYVCALVRDCLGAEVLECDENRLSITALAADIMLNSAPTKSAASALKASKFHEDAQCVESKDSVVPNVFSASLHRILFFNDTKIFFKYVYLSKEDRKIWVKLCDTPGFKVAALHGFGRMMLTCENLRSSYQSKSLSVSLTEEGNRLGTRKQEEARATKGGFQHRVKALSSGNWGSANMQGSSLPRKLAKGVQSETGWCMLFFRIVGEVLDRRANKNASRVVEQIVKKSQDSDINSTIKALIGRFPLCCSPAIQFLSGNCSNEDCLAIWNLLNRTAHAYGTLQDFSYCPVPNRFGHFLTSLKEVPDFQWNKVPTMLVNAPFKDHRLFPKGILREHYGAVCALAEIKGLFTPFENLKDYFQVEIPTREKACGKKIALENTPWGAGGNVFATNAKITLRVYDKTYAGGSQTATMFNPSIIGKETVNYSFAAPMLHLSAKAGNNLEAILNNTNVALKKEGKAHYEKVYGSKMVVDDKAICRVKITSYFNELQGQTAEKLGEFFNPHNKRIRVNSETSYE